MTTTTEEQPKSLAAIIWHLLWLGGSGIFMMYHTSVRDPQFTLRGASMFPTIIGWHVGNEIIRENHAYVLLSSEFTLWYKDTQRRFLYALFFMSVGLIIPSLKWQLHLFVYWSMFVLVAVVLSQSSVLTEDTKFYLWLVIVTIWYSVNEMNTNVFVSMNCAMLLYKIFGVLTTLKISLMSTVDGQMKLKMLGLFGLPYTFLLLFLFHFETQIIKVCEQLVHAQK
jgi:hypothetical protein